MSSLPYRSGIDPDGPDRTERPFVLVSGRHEDTRYMMRLMLEGWGFDVAEAVDCGDCIRLAGQRKPSLVLVDAAIPFDESLEMVGLLKGSRHTSDVPVLMISGFGQDGYREAALQGGAADYLVKPVDFEELQRLVTSLARKDGSRQAKNLVDDQIFF
jgi:DNA-binding response OmpR family regulator